MILSSINTLKAIIVAGLVAACTYTPAAAFSPTIPIQHAVQKVCETETEDALIDYAKGLPNAETIVLKGDAVLNFRETIAEANGVPVTGVVEADTILFAHPRGGETGVVVFFKDGCRVLMVNAPVNEFFDILQKSKGF